jgi:thiol-disulfide isomerase/thioredoxin
MPVHHGARVRRTPAILLGAAAIAAAGCEGSPATQGPSTAAAGAIGTTSFPSGHRPAVPQVSGSTLTGGRLRLSGYRGTVGALNFWGSWCLPCRKEAPGLARLSRAYRGDGIRFPGVDVNDPGQGHVLAFERHYGIGYPSRYDPADRVVPAGVA